MIITNVYLNDNKQGTVRRPVRVEIVRSNKRSIWVRLPDGNVVKRMRKRDLV